MEDYDQFVQLCLSRLRRREEDEQEPRRPSSSLIRFHGRSILPPLLSGKQREEMQRLRDEAGKAAIIHKFTHGPRMAYVQTILQSIQLRTTPTLEELLQESEIQTSPPHRDTPQHLEGCLPDPPEVSPPCPPHSSCHVTEHPAAVSRETESGSRSFSPSQELSTLGGFFLHNTSDTIAKMPDIISHPPVDGEELERSGLESLYGDLMGGGGVHDASFHPPSMQRQDEIPVKKTGGSPAPPTAGPEPEEPRPLSLQVLLKKSQEHRRRQRALRNPAQGARTPHQRAPVQEQSLSDKENDEFLCIQTAAGGKRVPPVPSTQKPGENEPEEEAGGRTERTGLAGGNMGAEEATVLKNNQLNSFPKGGVCVFIQPTPADPDYQTGGGRFCPFPAPNICRSPVHCKSKGVRDGGTGGGGLTGPHVTEDQTEEVNLRSGDGGLPSTVTGREDVTVPAALSSRHIDHLEFSLSSLKTLISDLESTLKDSLDGPSLTDGPSQTDGPSLTDGPSQTDGNMQTEAGVKPAQLGLDQRSDCQRGGQGDACCREGVTTSHVGVRDTDDPTDQDREAETGSDPSLPPPAQRGMEGSTRSFLSAATHVHNSSRNAAGAGEPPRDWAGAGEPPRDWAGAGEPPRDWAGAGERPSEATSQSSLNQSYDVDTPSGLWLLEGAGARWGSESLLGPETGLSPDGGGDGGPKGTLRVKRRLLMHVTDETREGVVPTVTSCRTPPAVVLGNGCRGNQREQQEKLKQTHVAQLRALQAEHRKQQEELLQRYRPLLAAAVKGFLTRRLLRTERVARLQRTVRDTQQFLGQQSVGGHVVSRQDVFLQERVSLQLRAARYEVYDIFFLLSDGERMQLIGRDRELARERRRRPQKEPPVRLRGKSSLSAATQKSLQRKRGAMIQNQSAGGRRGPQTGPKSGPQSGPSADKRLR